MNQGRKRTRGAGGGMREETENSVEKEVIRSNCKAWSIPEAGEMQPECPGTPSIRYLAKGRVQRQWALDAADWV